MRKLRMEGQKEGKASLMFFFFEEREVPVCPGIQKRENYSKTYKHVQIDDIQKIFFKYMKNTKIKNEKNHHTSYLR